jgi:hypothetical protein
LSSIGRATQANLAQHSDIGLQSQGHRSVVVSVSLQVLAWDPQHRDPFDYGDLDYCSTTQTSEQQPYIDQVPTSVYTELASALESTDSSASIAPSRCRCSHGVDLGVTTRLLLRPRPAGELTSPVHTRRSSSLSTRTRQDVETTRRSGRFSACA